MEIRPVGGALILEMDGCDKLIGIFCNYVNMPNKWITKAMEPDTVDRLYASG